MRARARTDGAGAKSDFFFFGCHIVTAVQNQERTRTPPLHASLLTPILTVILWWLWWLKVAEVQCKWAQIGVVALKPVRRLISEFGVQVLTTLL
jgi:hypothetical protein